MAVNTDDITLEWFGKYPSKIALLNFGWLIIDMQAQRHSDSERKD